ncbi:MAG: transglycosylase SLT domain-containing protein [Planctomycetota bacterium]|nr:transglycosylase SLT domain-containing protein [Planctomycetota bacterium]
MQSSRAKRVLQSHWSWTGVGLCLALALFLVLRAKSPGMVVRAYDAIKAGGDMQQADLERIATFREALIEAAAESDVDPYMLAGIMYNESRGVGGQTSSAGALGLMQLSLAAAGDSAKRLKLPKPTKKELLEDSKLNIRLAASHWAWLLKHRGDWSEEAVLVSYNAGRTKLIRWIKAAGGTYSKWCDTEVRAEAQKRKTTGAMRYARNCQHMARLMRDRDLLELEPAAE